MAIIEVDHITHRFGEKTVLRGIDLTVEKGELVGLLGPSGAGKTTLINLMTGQMKPSEGCVRIQGKVLEKSGQVPAGTGIMMDRFGLYERLSVWENLRLFARINGVTENRIIELLDRTELLEARNTAVAKLSKGMRCRVNFCRALLKPIDILYLDEPTSGLDPVTTRKIHQLILEEKSHGTTIFLTTHNMYEAETLCDRVMLLNQGKIVEQGTPEQICNRYNHLNVLRVLLKDGTEHTLPNAAESAGAVREWLEQEQIRSIHSSEPDLENVFLDITGRRLEG